MAPTKAAAANITVQPILTQLVRGLIGLVIMITMTWIGFLHAEISDLQSEDKSLGQRLATTKDQIMSKVSRLEPSLAALKADMTTMKGRLENIDRKLDRVLLRATSGRRR